MDVLHHTLIKEGINMNMVDASNSLTPKALHIFRKVTQQSFYMKPRKFLMVLILFIIKVTVIVVKRDNFKLKVKDVNVML